jgi:hypothetical protein
MPSQEPRAQNIVVRIVRDPEVEGAHRALWMDGRNTSVPAGLMERAREMVRQEREEIGRPQERYGNEYAYTHARVARMLEAEENALQAARERPLWQGPEPRAFDVFGMPGEERRRFREELTRRNHPRLHELRSDASSNGSTRTVAVWEDGYQQELTPDDLRGMPPHATPPQIEQYLIGRRMRREQENQRQFRTEYLATWEEPVVDPPAPENVRQFNEEIGRRVADGRIDRVRAELDERLRDPIDASYYAAVGDSRVAAQPADENPLTPADPSLDCHTSVTVSSSESEATAMYRPWVNRFFGVEMEMTSTSTESVSISERDLKGAIRSVPGARLNDREAGYFHSTGETWDVKTDASCGWEISTPKLKLDENAHNAELKGVCEALARLRPNVNRTCGLHVTVDVSDFSWRDMRNLVVLWARYEPYVFELCPPTRRANQYCKPIRKARWADPSGAHWSAIERLIQAPDRTPRGATETEAFPRGALNLRGWWSGKRVEFRLQAGTINYEKIRRWTQFVLSFVARVKAAPPFPMIQSGGWSDKGFSTLYVFKMLGLAPSSFCPEVPQAAGELMAWAEQRRALFRENQNDGVGAAARSAPVNPFPTGR